MSQSQIISVGREEWLQLAAQFLDHNYRQSWEYGIQLAKHRKSASHHVKIQRSGEVIGLADVRIKRASFLGGIAYISGGPLTRKGASTDIENLGYSLEALRRQYVETKGLILRIQGSWGDRVWNEQSAACFTSCGFGLANRGAAYRTLVLDLRPPLGEIRTTLVQKWRNCLNKAERCNPVPMVSARIEDFERFTSLFNPFVGRKGFKVDLDARFYQAVQRYASPLESLQLTAIESNGQLIGGHVSSRLGDTCVYLLGATSDAGLKTNAGYLLQWNVIQRAKEQGAIWYDLGGIDPAENPGVFHFKNGMGGIEVNAPGPFELAPKAFRSYLVLAAESAYRRLRAFERTRRPMKSSLSSLKSVRPAAESQGTF